MPACARDIWRSGGMTSLIRIDFALRWTVPVYVRDRMEVLVPVIGPSAALRFLLSDFLICHGEKYRPALTACRLAVRNRAAPSHARLCFVDAYVEYMEMRVKR